MIQNTYTGAGSRRRSSAWPSVPAALMTGWTINILVVEDDPADGSLIMSALTRHPDVAFARLASDPEIALKRIADGTFQPDLILLDINMPKMNGFVFADELRRHPSSVNTPVAFLTTSRHARDIEAARHRDVCSYIVKPDTFADLQARLDVVIKRVKSHDWSSK
jgi:DNA-binding response OmpR family regulator